MSIFSLVMICTCIYYHQLCMLGYICMCISPCLLYCIFLFLHRSGDLMNILFVCPNVLKSYQLLYHTTYTLLISHLKPLLYSLTINKYAWFVISCIIICGCVILLHWQYNYRFFMTNTHKKFLIFFVEVLAQLDLFMGNTKLFRTKNFISHVLKYNYWDLPLLRSFIP